MPRPYPNKYQYKPDHGPQAEVPLCASCLVYRTQPPQDKPSSQTHCSQPLSHSQTIPASYLALVLLLAAVVEMALWAVVVMVVEVAVRHLAAVAEV